MRAKDKAAVRGFVEFAKQAQGDLGVDISETTEAKKKRISGLLSNYDNFIAYYTPQFATAPLADFHIEFVNFLQNNKKCFVVMEWARDHAKSITACTLMPLFLMFKKDFKNCLIVSKSNENAAELLQPLQAILENNQRIINDFGQQKPITGEWQAGNFTTTNGISFKAVGRQQSPRGTRKGATRPDLIIVDDIDDDELVLSESRVDKAWMWFCQALIPAMSIKGGRLVFVQNNYAENSLINKAVAHCKQLMQKGFPAFHKKINILNSDGQPSWATRFTLQECKQMIETIGYIAAQREYFNNPISKGKHFKPSYIQFTSILPLVQYNPIYSYCDPSFSEKGDTKSIILVGYKNQQYHIIKVFCDKASISDMIRWHYEIDKYITDEKIAAKHYMESVFYQKQNLDRYYNDYAKTNATYPLPIVADKRTKPNKEVRLLALTALFESGLIYFNKQEKDNRHMQNLVQQLLAFDPPKKTAVDGIDALEGCIYLIKNNIQDYTAAIKLGNRKKNGTYFY